VLSFSGRVGPVAAAVAVAVAVSVTLASGCSSKSGPAVSTGSVVTSTTKVAGAGVLGNQRRPDESCAADPAPLDPDADQRTVRHAAGETELHGDPQRIVVLSGDQLDALCSLGLQSRIVAAAVPETAPGQPGPQPSYLGTVIHNLPAVGTRNAPDVNAIKAANPDLILGSQTLTPDSYRALTAIAPTVFTGAPGPGWQDTLRTVGAATGRPDDANRLIDDFKQDAEKVRAQNDASHFQASVVQLTPDTMRVYGADDFPGSVLAAVGLDRPAGQRFKDKPYLELGTTDLKHTDFSAADGDIVYVSFDSAAAKERAATVLDDAAWKKLSATRDNRVFVVNNEVWQTGEGLVAARGMLDDLRFVNAPIN
jgi:iron complex transport system substrate-binding protein